MKIKDYPRRNPIFACHGCNKAHNWTAAGGWECIAWKVKPWTIRVFGECAMNRVIVTKAKRARVGQQKTKRNR